MPHTCRMELKVFRRVQSRLQTGMDCKLYYVCIITVLSAATQLHLSRNANRNLRLGKGSLDAGGIKRTVV